ncbi:helix-turn-helix transcriptional regulator [Halioxenophilus aromaticivorans]|uniref:HTH araC/xylS-type domain-containing protein n=1 Tax=Halioxenophilus aromaticivorans TaxID=1306992 RepID=A0AAV3U308_9ALTE
MASFSRMYLWRNRALYLTPQLVQAKDFVAGSDQLIVCLDGHITRSFPNHPDVHCRTSLLRAGAKIPQMSVTNHWSRLAICHLNSLAQDFYATRSQMQLEVNGDYFNHQNETEIIRQLNRVFDEDLATDDTAQVLDDLIIAKHLKQTRFQRIDPRIESVKACIEDNIRENLVNADLAKSLNMSESRLVKLFRQQMGIPLTRFRIHFRVHVGLLYITLGYSVTQAALSTGFSSTAHFSRCFSDVFGVPPSSEFLHPPFLEVKLGQDTLAALQRRAQSDSMLGKYVQRYQQAHGLGTTLSPKSPIATESTLKTTLKTNPEATLKVLPKVRAQPAGA